MDHFCITLYFGLKNITLSGMLWCLLLPYRDHWMIETLLSAMCTWKFSNWTIWISARNVFSNALIVLRFKCIFHDKLLHSCENFCLKWEPNQVVHLTTQKTKRNQHQTKHQTAEANSDSQQESTARNTPKKLTTFIAKWKEIITTISLFVATVVVDFCTLQVLVKMAAMGRSFCRHRVEVFSVIVVCRTKISTKRNDYK